MERLTFFAVFHFSYHVGTSALLFLPGQLMHTMVIAVQTFVMRPPHGTLTFRW
jgi:hypothetical protein